MSGARLEADFHIITAQTTAINNINRCVKRADLISKDLILEPLASSLSVLSDVDKEAGVCLVDIGGGTTDIAIFYDNIIRHTAVIPFGGNIITSDIKEGCMVMQNQAELFENEVWKSNCAGSQSQRDCLHSGIEKQASKGNFHPKSFLDH